MKNPLFAFSACLRHAFMSGAGYGDHDRITDYHIDAWCNYDPPESGPFTTMAKLIAGENVVVDGEPPKTTLGSILELYPAKDLEYMRKNILASIPVGSVWMHVEYIPLYRCDISEFTRQAVNHEKAFAVRFTMVDDGSTFKNGAAYPTRYHRPPAEKETEE
jgi:hypothetical protein